MHFVASELASVAEEMMKPGFVAASGAAIPLATLVATYSVYSPEFFGDNMLKCNLGIHDNIPVDNGEASSYLLKLSKKILIPVGEINDEYDVILIYNTIEKFGPLGFLPDAVVYGVTDRMEMAFDVKWEE